MIIVATTKYNFLNPPEDIKKFDRDYHWTLRSVEYDAHPAYADFIETASFASRVKARMIFYKSLVPLLLKRLIKYEMIPLETRKPQNIAGWMKFLGTALKNALGISRAAPLEGKTGKILENLQENGCSVIVIPDQAFEKLEAHAEAQFRHLEERRKKTGGKAVRGFEESRGSVDSRVEGDKLFKTINTILQDSGILDAASRYLKREVRLVDVNPQINDKTDGFWRNIFPDLNYPKIPEMAYFHRDASGGDLKAIFYYSDVNDETGPFSYAIGSNNIKISRWDDLICEANDHNGLSGTENNHRQQFAALPHKFRQKGAFGNDLLESSDLKDKIKESLWKITASRGSIVLFDTKGIHRGGMVVDGERRVITCVIG